MKKVSSHARNKGFTLVEVIVVLVILAILAAIMIPAMTGWIDKARQKAAIAACRTCVVAAQTLASEQYAEGAVNVTPDEVQGLARIGGSVDRVSIALPAFVDALIYTDPNSVTVTYLRRPQPHYILGAGIGLSTDGAAIASNIYTLNGLANTTAFGQRIDSSGYDADTGFFKAMTESADWPALEAALAGLSIQEWSIQKEGKTNVVWITDQNLNAYSPGDWVRVIRYNTSKETYTAGYLQVKEEDGKPKLERVSNLSSKEDKAKWSEYAGQENTKDDPTETAEIFNTMPLQKP